MIENLTDLFLYKVAPDLNITGGGGHHTNSNLLKDLWVAQKFAAAF